MRNVLEEFGSDKYGKSKPTILGLREHIVTGRYIHLSKVLSNIILLIPFMIYFSVSNLFFYLVFHHLLGLCQIKRPALLRLDSEFWQILSSMYHCFYFRIFNTYLLFFNMCFTFFIHIEQFFILVEYFVNT